MQSVKPNAAWEGLTPVPMEELFSSILEGRMELRLPLANGLAPERAILIRSLVAMPIEQHLQLQVIHMKQSFISMQSRLSLVSEQLKSI